MAQQSRCLGAAPLFVPLRVPDGSVVRDGGRVVVGTAAGAAQTGHASSTEKARAGGVVALLMRNAIVV